MRDPKLREAHEVSILLPPSRTVRVLRCRVVYDGNKSRQKQIPAFFEYSADELLRDYATFVQPSGPDAQMSGLSLQNRVSELESEVAKLKEQLGKAKGINDTIWETVVQKVVAGSRDKVRENAMDVDEVVPARIDRQARRG